MHVFKIPKADDKIAASTYAFMIFYIYTLLEKEAKSMI